MKKKLTIIALVMMLTICFNFVFASANAQTKAVEANHIESTNTKLASNVNIPTCDINMTSYNQVVVFTWTVGSNGTELRLSNNWVTFYPMGTHYVEHVFPSYDLGLEQNACTPWYTCGQSYSSITNSYSDLYYIEYEWIRPGHIPHLCDSWPSKYLCVDKLDYFDGYVPTSYGDDNFTWNHNSGVGHSVRATIEYKGILADIDVDIPLLFYFSTYVSINGVRFDLRVGNSRCFLKTSNSNVSASDVRFSFGVGDPLPKA